MPLEPPPLALLPLEWIRAHPLAATLLVACALVGVGRVFFRATRRFLERFDELPEPSVLSTPELVVLGSPRVLDAARLARAERVWRAASRVAAVCAVAVLALAVGGSVVRGAAPRAAVLERLDALRAELDDELSERAARRAGIAPVGQLGALEDPRARELADRLRAALIELDARADRAQFSPEERERERKAAALLARAEARPAALLELVPEEALARAAVETERGIARELELVLARARAFRALGDVHRALPLQERAAALRPGRTDVALELAETLLQLGRPADALARLASVPLEGTLDGAARGAAGARVRAQLVAGQARAELGDDAAALGALDEAVELLRAPEHFPPSPGLDRDLARALRARARVLARLERAGAARADLAAALALGSDAPATELARAQRAELLLDRAQLALALGEPAAALEDLERAAPLCAAPGAGLESGPRAVFGAELDLARAAALRALGRGEEAHERLDAAIEALEPDAESVPRLLAGALLEHARLGLAAGTSELALADAERALALLERARARGAAPHEAELLAARELRAVARRALGRDAPGPALASAEPATPAEPGAAGPIAAPETELAAALPAAAPALLASSDAESPPTDPAQATSAPESAAALEQRIAAWERSPAEERDALDRAPALDLLERAALRREAGEDPAAARDLDRAIELLRERLGALHAARIAEPLPAAGEPPPQPGEAELDLARALDRRGGLRAIEARFELAQRDFDEAVALRGGPAARPTEPTVALELAGALRSRALAAFNRRHLRAALDDLDAAVAVLEDLGGREALGEQLAARCARELDALRQQLALVMEAAPDPPPR